MSDIRNKIITISGEPVSGKSTVVKMIKEKYENMGYRVHIVTTGNLFRERVIKEYSKMYPSKKDINLAVTKQVEKILTSNGVKVKLTRTGDTYPQLEERSAFANELNAAIFVSIHSNSATVESANGIEVFYASKNNSNDYGVKSQELADKILTAMITHTKANNRKVKTENHLVTRTSVMPAALVELGFVSNKAELKNLLDEEYQYSLASGIAEGIMKCLPKITIPDKTDTGFDPDKLGDKIF